MGWYRWTVVVLALCLLPTFAAQNNAFSPDGPLTGISREEIPAGDADAARLVVRFVQISDAHIIDDDVPTPFRVEPTDPIGPPFTSAYRPQEEFTDEVLNAVIARINEIHEQTPIDFLVFTGDNTDNSIENEVVRFLDNLQGTFTTTGPLSGLTCVPDGQGDDNDVQDQCTHLPESMRDTNLGLHPDIRVFEAFGNHDALIQGNVNANDAFQLFADQQIGRELLDQGEYIDLHFSPPVACGGGSDLDRFGFGYGFVGERLCDEDPDNDGYYSVSLNGVRVIVLDTINDDFLDANGFYSGLFPAPQAVAGNDLIGGYAEGSLDPAQYEWLLSEIENNQDELILLFSHHTTNSMFTDSAFDSCAPGVGCISDLLEAAGYKTGVQLIEELSRYPNVFGWIGGHTHYHRIELKQGSTGGSFWNVETSSLIDLPQEFRVIEVYTDGENAALRTQNQGHNFTESYEIALTDEQTDEAQFGEPKDQDVILWKALPDSVRLEALPELDRILFLARGSEDLLVAGENRIQVRFTDQIRDVPIEEVNATYTFETIDRILIEEPQPMVAVPGEAGVYEAVVNVTERGTHYLKVTASAEGYPDNSRVFSLEVDPEGIRVEKESNALGLLPLIGLLAIAMVRRRA